MIKSDLVIRGGTIADGLGDALFEADIAVANGQIVEVGKCASSGVEEIDAKGKLVTPGFVDIHTHYDGQVVWDERMAPSSLHGVTTVVMGNCGVGFAPVRPNDRDRLIELMEGVEDIPGVVLRKGLEWAWESFGEYLGYIGSKRYDIDVAAQLPHAPLRVFVMGERACRLEDATEKDIAEMRRLTADAMRAGAVGFSTSRSLNHRAVNGDPTPSLKASEAELLGIAQGIVDGGGGVFEFAHEFAEQGREAEFAMIRRVAATTGLHFSFGLMQRPAEPDGWRDILRLISEARDAGVQITGQVTPRPIGAIITVEGTANPLQMSPTYKRIVTQSIPLAEKVTRLRTPEVRAKVLAEAETKSGGSIVARLGGFDRLFVQRGAIAYEPRVEDSIGRRAAKEGVSPMVMLYDQLHEGDGSSFVYFPVMNYAAYNLDPVRVMLDHPHTVIGLGDGGAHVSIIADASFPTTLLSRWSKARSPDGFDLSWLVKRQTSDTARTVGMDDRGVIAVGKKADINVIDVDRLSLMEPVMTPDLPAGGLRLLQKASGYDATIVSGEVVYRNGEATGALPGRLVKGKAA